MSIVDIRIDLEHPLLLLLDLLLQQMNITHDGSVALHAVYSFVL